MEMGRTTGFAEPGSATIPNNNYFRMVRLKISNSLSTNSLSLNSIKRGSSSSWYSSSSGSWYSSTADEFSFNSLSTNTLKSYYDLAKINNGVNMLKLEEKQRQKVRKIMGGSDGISNSCRPIRNFDFSMSFSSVRYQFDIPS